MKAIFCGCGPYDRRELSGCACGKRGRKPPARRLPGRRHSLSFLYKTDCGPLGLRRGASQKRLSLEPRGRDGPKGRKLTAGQVRREVVAKFIGSAIVAILGIVSCPRLLRMGNGHLAFVGRQGMFFDGPVVFEEGGRCEVLIFTASQRRLRLMCPSCSLFRFSGGSLHANT